MVNFPAFRGCLIDVRPWIPCLPTLFDLFISFWSIRALDITEEPGARGNYHIYIEGCAIFGIPLLVQRVNLRVSFLVRLQ